MERLKTGVYQDLYDYNQKAVDKLAGDQQE
jgi:hypothetical protein